MIRATLEASMGWPTQPIMTSSTSSGSMPVLWSNSVTQSAPSFCAGRPSKSVHALTSGVLTPSTITMSLSLMRPSRILLGHQRLDLRKQLLGLLFPALDEFAGFEEMGPVRVDQDGPDQHVGRFALHLGDLGLHRLDRIHQDIKKIGKKIPLHGTLHPGPDAQKPAAAPHGQRLLLSRLLEEDPPLPDVLRRREHVDGDDLVGAGLVQCPDRQRAHDDRKSVG